MSWTDGPRVYYIGTDHHVLELCYTGGRWSANDLAEYAAGAADAAEGSPLAATAWTDGPRVYYIGGTDGLVWELGYSGRWGAQNSTKLDSNAPAAAPGSGLAAMTWRDTLRVYYIGADRHLWQLSYENGRWGAHDSTTLDSRAAQAEPGSTVAATAWTDGPRAYYIGGTDGHVWQLGYSGGWAAQDSTTFAPGAPAAISGSHLAASTGGDGLHVYYIGADSHLWELAYQGDWAAHDLSPKDA